MKPIARFLTSLALLALAGCGGGGGGGTSSGGAFNPVVYQVSVTTGAASISQNSTTPVTVSVKRSDGTAVPEGTKVTVTSTPANAGTLGTSLSNATSNLSLAPLRADRQDSFSSAPRSEALRYHGVGDQSGWKHHRLGSCRCRDQRHGEFVADHYAVDGDPAGQSVLVRSDADLALSRKFLGFSIYR